MPVTASWSSDVRLKNLLPFSIVSNSTIKRIAVTITIVPKMAPESGVIPDR